MSPGTSPWEEVPFIVLGVTGGPACNLRFRAVKGGLPCRRSAFHRRALFVTASCSSRGHGRDAVPSPGPMPQIVASY